MIKAYFVFLALLCFSVASNAQSIEDMYIEIPGNLLGLSKGIDKDAKKKLIKEVDNACGFMALKGENDMELAKFTLKGAEPILAVAETSYINGRKLNNTLTFFTKKLTVWTDVTEQYLEKIPGLVIDAFSREKCKTEISNSASGTFRYKLPRKGRTIRAVAESDVIMKPCTGDLFHLEFESMRFTSNNSWYNYLVMKFNKS